jgi:hypothetical protein
MGEDADEVGARCDDPVGHLEQLGIVRLQSAAMVVAVQFDEDGRRHAGGRAHVGQGIGLLHGVEQQLQVGARAATKLHGADGRSRRQADRIGHVAKAVAGEILRLGDGRDRDRAGSPGNTCRATSMLLAVFMCGRSTTPSFLARSARRWMLRSSRPRSRSSDGVTRASIVSAASRALTFVSIFPVSSFPNRTTGLPGHTSGPARRRRVAAP